MVITIGAMIGAGKTSLAKLLGEHFGTEVYYESVEDNPVLPLFYGNQKEYAFKLQLWFLNTRFRSIKDALKNDNNILDRSIYEDWYFAKRNFEDGNMTKLEFGMYESLLENMMEEIDGMPKKSPDLMVYLSGSFETIIERILKRGRGYELEPELLSYYKKLWEGYDNWVFNHYKASEILVIDIDKYDYVNNESDKLEVLKLVEDKLKEIRKGEPLMKVSVQAELDLNDAEELEKFKNEVDKMGIDKAKKQVSEYVVEGMEDLDLKTTAINVSINTSK